MQTIKIKAIKAFLSFLVMRNGLEEEPVDVPTDQEALQGLETVIGWLGAQQDVEQVKIMQLVSP
jgi:hypothetical protein